MRRIGFSDVFRAVAWGINDFSSHSLHKKSSVHPFSDIETPMLGSTVNHSGENSLPEKTNPGEVNVPSAQTHSMIVTRSRLALCDL
jgi:hypothetical protein